MRQLTKLVALTTVIGASVTAVALVVGPRDEGVKVHTVQLTDTSGLYVGNDVQVVGVTVGKVRAIEPRGTRTNVTIEVDDDVRIAADTGALVMQSSLVTDRFVELTAPWTEGPVLADGATIGLENTKSPANVDDVFAAVDELVVALRDGGSGGGGADIAEVLDVGADQLEGKGVRVAQALEAADDALGVLDRHDDDIVATVENLDGVVSMVAERDDAVRELTDSVADATQLLDAQRKNLTASMETVEELSRTATDFVERNREVVRTDLEHTNHVLKVAAARTDSITEVFDVLPLVAENITRAYDPETRNTRIRVNLRDTGPFSPVGRSDLCELLSVPNCDLLTAPDGSGLLDPLLQWVTELFPEDF